MEGNTHRFSLNHLSLEDLCCCCPDTPNEAATNTETTMTTGADGNSWTSSDELNQRRYGTSDDNVESNSQQDNDSLPELEEQYGSESSGDESNDEQLNASIATDSNPDLSDSVIFDGITREEVEAMMDELTDGNYAFASSNNTNNYNNSQSSDNEVSEQENDDNSLPELIQRDFNDSSGDEESNRGG